MRSLQGLLTVALLAVPLAVSAVPVTTACTFQRVSGACAESVANVTIQGSSYDVSFEYGAAIELFADFEDAEALTFWLDSEGAEAAAHAISNQLDGLIGITPPGGAPVQGGAAVLFALGDGKTGQHIWAAGLTGIEPPSGEWASALVDQVAVDMPIAYALFERVPQQAPVSEPGTLGLLGLGLAAVGLARRRR